MTYTITYDIPAADQSTWAHPVTLIRDFADEASADIFLASLTTRRDAYLFTNIRKIGA